MYSFKQTILNQKVIFIFALLFASIYLYLFMNRAYVQIDLHTSRNTLFKIYWANKEQPYSEKRSAEVPINKRRSKYLLYLANIGNAEKLRIDPAEKPAQIRIKHIVIKQNHYKTIRFSKPDEFDQLIPLNDIKDIHNIKNGFMVVTSGNDPQLEIHIQPNKMANGYLPDILRIICFVIFIIVLVKNFNMAMDNVHFAYISYLMIVAGTLILIMASISKFNRHPDEYVHVKAGDYYEDHWIPPKICEPGTEKTYSVYGVSRLNSHELVYFIAGKFSALFGFLPINSFFRLRAFNVLLFIILVVLNIKLPGYRIVSIPLLLSPQIWYVFSYFNSDAFSLFIVFITIYQIVKEDSLLNRFLSETRQKIDIPSGVTIGLLFYILFTLKKNFYFFVIFILIYFVIKIFNKEFTNPYLLIKRLIFIFLVLFLMFSLRFAGDIYINGIDKEKKLNDCREKLAKTAYKPSTPMEKRMPGLNIKEKGVSLKDVLIKYRWGEKSFRSAFGVYGYTSISASESYYDIPRVVGLLFVLFIFWSSLFKTNCNTKLLLLNAIICSVLLIGAALWKSWTSDFQAQGRYFLPIVAISGFLLYQIKGVLNKQLFNLFVLLMFLTSVYSFIFIGLIAIPKHI